MVVTEEIKPARKKDVKVRHLNSGIRLLLTRDEAAEYGDTSAVYWKLYVSEAEDNDQKLVESLSGDTNSMLILVRGASTDSIQCSILLRIAEWPIFLNSCKFHRRNIPVPAARQWPT